MNIIAPKAPVMIPTGISDVVRDRANKSQHIVKKEPNKADKTIAFFESLLTNRLIKLGIARPTQPTVPLIDTERAVIKVANVIMQILILLTLIPCEIASKSEF